MPAFARTIALAALLLASSCRTAPAPYGEAIVVVDTDLAVPELAGRLRVDVFDAAGHWKSSDDFVRSSALDWPASFSVYANGPEEKVLYVRLRAYPEGLTRPYRGERYQSREPRLEPRAHTTIADLCASPPVISPGESVAVRRGRNAFVGTLTGSPDCNRYATTVGSAAVMLNIPTAGTYSFGVLATAPTEISVSAGSIYYQTTIQLRKECGLAPSVLACASGIEPTGGSSPAVVTRALSAGQYWLVTGGAVASQAPADLLIGLAETPEKLAALAAPIRSDDLPHDPDPMRLELEVGATPSEEPAPEVTVDRLIKVRLTYGVRGVARVLLDGRCVGAMTKLGDGVVDLDHATTCVTDPSAPITPADEALDADLSTPPSVAGTFAKAAGCPASDATAPVVCVEGGAFLMGGTADGSLPQRTVAVSTFSIDRREVSIGRFRDALTRGLRLESRDMPIGAPSQNSFWSDKPGTHESYPVTSLPWYGARAFCRFVGGDLPSEAQWEYAASRAGRDRKTRFPWGDDEPVCSCVGVAEPCHQIVMQRAGDTYSPDGPGCVAARAIKGGANVDAMGGPHGDVTPLGIEGMAGNASEWTRDAFLPYDGRCWRATSVVDPMCEDADALFHGARGAFWYSLSFQARAYVRIPQPAGVSGATLGFRCAYPVAP